MRIIKNLFLILILLGVIVLSFWLSFTLGKNMLTPVKKKISTTDFIKQESKALDKIGKITFEVQSISVESEAPATQEPAYMKPKIAETRSAFKKQAPVQKPITKEAEKITASSCVVQLGIFSSPKNAHSLIAKLKTHGYSAISETYGKHTRVFIRSNNLSDAKILASKIRQDGFEAIVRRK